MAHPLAALAAALQTPHTTRLRLGRRGFLGLETVSLPLDTFDAHLYVVGQSGQGKSKFLQHVLAQFVASGWGCGLLDPHSDLAADLLAQLASHPQAHPWLDHAANRQRLLYIDPARDDFLIPCNLLHDPGATPYETAENVVEAFRRVWPTTLAEAPRFAQILRSALIVLIANGLALLELEPLLTDAAFRRNMLRQVDDPLVRSFFAHQYDRWRREQPIFAAPVLNKVSAFLFQPPVRRMLGAAENRLDFRRILDEGRVLVVDLGGFRDEETQRLLGSLLLTGLEQAAFARSTQPAGNRRPFFCAVDEFPLFASRDPTSLARILSGCRKYRLHLGLAHQTIAQLAQGRLQGALENAQLKAVFGSGRQTAEAVVKELFLPDPQAVKHEVRDAAAQARTHPLFDPLLEQFEVSIQRIQRLRPRRALLKLPGQEQAVSVRIPFVPPARIDTVVFEGIRRSLAQTAGQPVQELERQIARRARDHGVPGYDRVSSPDRGQLGGERPSGFWR